MVTERIDRRTFIKGGIMGVAGLSLEAVLGSSSTARIALARSPKVVLSPATFDPALIDQMLARAVCLLTGEKRALDGWAKLIQPGKADVIGLKTSNLGGRTCRTAPELVYAVARCLQAIGVDKGRIIIWDRTSSELADRGYIISEKSGDVRCFGTLPGRGYSDRGFPMGNSIARLSRILTDDISILINMPMMKDHGGAGITGALKNHYGSVQDPQQFHQNNCDPGIADLNNLAPIRNKTRLVVFDAMRPLYNGGPGDQPDARWNYGGIYLAQDPVAADAFSLRLIDQRRILAGIRPIAPSRRARHIATAAGLGLGTDKLDQVQILGDPAS